MKKIILFLTLLFSLSTNKNYTANYPMYTGPNSCFFNSLSQVFLKNEKLSYFINKTFNKPGSIDTNKKNIDTIELKSGTNTQEKEAIIKEYIKLSLEINDPLKKGKTFPPGQAQAPHDLYKAVMNFAKKSKRFPNRSNTAFGVSGIQHDADELLSLLLEMLTEPEFDTTKEIRNIFGYKLLSRLTCPKCNHQSDTIETLLDKKTFEEKSVALKLSIPASKKTIDQNLEEFFKTETLDAKNKWKCGKCNQYVLAKKELLFQNSPSILIIHLKRFKKDLSKIDHLITFPTTQTAPLVISKYLSNEQQRADYKLIGVIMHSGSFNRGHYWTKAFDHETDTWRTFNDNSAVKKINDITADVEKSTHPYILFYERLATPLTISPPASPASVPQNIESLLKHLQAVGQRTKDLHGVISSLQQDLKTKKKTPPKLPKKLTQNQKEKLKKALKIKLTQKTLKKKPQTKKTIKKTSPVNLTKSIDLLIKNLESTGNHTKNLHSLMRSLQQAQKLKKKKPPKIPQKKGRKKKALLIPQKSKPKKKKATNPGSTPNIITMD